MEETASQAYIFRLWRLFSDARYAVFKARKYELEQYSITPS